MRFVLAVPFLLLSFCVSAQNDDVAVIQRQRAEKDKEFRDRAKSPLTKKEIRKFKGLKYFPVDLQYKVTAKFVRNDAPALFKMKTTTPRLPEYSKFGEVKFTLQGKEYTLEVYQSPEISMRPGYKDYLFIPFTDETNGKETYIVGRYLEMRIPAGDEVVLDFNLCYSPYCSYSDKYSCPIPPAPNQLPLEVKAGEKAFKDHH